MRIKIKLFHFFSRLILILLYYIFRCCLSLFLFISLSFTLYPLSLPLSLSLSFFLALTLSLSFSLSLSLYLSIYLSFYRFVHLSIFYNLFINPNTIILKLKLKGYMRPQAFTDMDITTENKSIFYHLFS